jgi:membrane-associated protease RseP (regulator of RpoE activity)
LEEEMKKLKILLVAVLLGLLIGGCSAGKIWIIPPGGDRSSFERDKAQCIYEARAQVPPAAPLLVGFTGNRNVDIAGSITALLVVGAQVSAQKAVFERAFRNCMQARGYEFADKSSLGTTGIIFDGRDPSKEVIVTGVMPNSPADFAGIKPGDKCIEKNYAPISCVADIVALGRLYSGSLIKYKFLRNGEEISVTLTAIPMVPYPNGSKVIELQSLAW